MDKKLFSLRTHFLYTSIKTFFLLFFMLTGVSVWGQYYNGVGQMEVLL
ncbi:hypothetical protein [Epilithonimonas hispanica]|nr:hypothetical protein [Epilithonimonas hispanica]